MNDLHIHSILITWHLAISLIYPVTELDQNPKWIYTYINICTQFICKYSFLYISMSDDIYIYIYMRIYIYVYVFLEYVVIYIYLAMYIYIHNYEYIYIFTHVTK